MIVANRNNSVVIGPVRGLMWRFPHICGEFLKKSIDSYLRTYIIFASEHEEALILWTKESNYQSESSPNSAE